MDRQIVYPGQILPETSLLQMAKDSMIGLAKLSAAVLGTSTLANGFAVTPTGPASLQVVCAPGEIYSLTSIDALAFSTLPADTTHSIMKQGILLDGVTLSCPAPGTTGQSINYLVQVTYQDSDSTPVLLPYYNSANPALPYSGMGNNGLTQNTNRKGIAVVAVKAGASAVTGSQVTPAPDAGYVGLYVVTVAFGQTTITAGNITNASNAPLINSTLHGLSPAFTVPLTVPTATQSQHAVPLSQAQTLVAAGPAIQGNFKNLTLSATGTSASVAIAADEIVVGNASNQYLTLRAVSVTASTAGTLANGLDTGTIATSTWYSVWVIWNGTTIASLLSLSATAPTMPSGYTHKARVGWIRTDGTANKYPLSFIQNGKNVQYKVATASNVAGLPVLANGTAGTITTPPTWVAVGISSIVPSTASRIKLYAANTTANAGTIIAAPNNSYAGTATGTPPPLVMSNVGSSPNTTYCEFVVETTNIYWASAGTAGQSLICLGWEDSL